EAIDFTRARLPLGESHAVVRSFMAHHQAMSILGISNALLGGVLRHRFHSDAMIEATELLLQERKASDAYLARPQRKQPAPLDAAEQYQALEWRMDTPHSKVRRTHLLSNNRYSVMMTSAGSGYSRWGDLALTRWREDVTRDPWGSYLFIRDVKSNLVWSA